MKKRYWLFIFIVLFFMISSVLIFLFKVSDSEASALFTSYLNNLYSSEGLSKNECSESFPQSYTKNKIQMNQNIQKLYQQRLERRDSRGILQRKRMFGKTRFIKLQGVRKIRHLRVVSNNNKGGIDDEQNN